MNASRLPRASKSLEAHNQSNDTFFRKLKLSHWILLIMLITTGLTVIVSGLGIFSIADVQRTLATSSAAVQNKLEFQNRRLQAKSQQFELATEISDAHSVAELDKILRGHPELRNRSADDLALKISNLFTTQRQYLVFKEKLAALNSEVEASLGKINAGVNAVVRGIDDKTDAQASDALSMLSTHAQSQRTTLLDAMKDMAGNPADASNQIAKVSKLRDRTYMDGKVVWETLQNAGNKVKSSLDLRSECWMIGRLLTQVQSAGAVAEVAQAHDTLTNLFYQATTHLAGLDPALTGGLSTNIAVLQDQALGEDGVISLVLNVLRAEITLAREKEQCHRLVQATDQGVISQAAILQSESAFELSKSVTRASINRHSMIVLASAALAVALALMIFLVPRILQPLQRISDRVSRSAIEVSTAATQIAGTGELMAHSAATQTQATLKSVGSLEEIGDLANRNSASLRTVNELARETCAAADQSLKEIRVMQDAMNLLQRSEQEISNVVKTIDTIAFQTNLLALNAAVEAARAGQHGAGFAVVADEVRKLAGESASAARETAAKIDQTIEKTRKGHESSARVLGRLTEIIEKIRNLETLIAAAAKASCEQDMAVKQAKDEVVAVEHLAQGTAQNAASSRHAAEQLNTQAESLAQALQDLTLLVSGEKADAHPNRLLSPTTRPTPATLPPSNRLPSLI